MNATANSARACRAGPDPMELTEPQEQPAPSLKEFLYHAYDQRRPALTLAGAILSLALVLAAVMPAKYRATATLVVLPSPEFTVREAAGSHESSSSALALDQIMKAETEILGSDDLHAAVLRQAGAARLYPEVFAPAARGVLARMLHAVADAGLSPWRTRPKDQAAARQEQGLHRFHSDLAVLPAKDSNVITVTFDNKDGAQAAAAVNALLDVYATRRTRLYDDPQQALVRHEAASAADASAHADQALAAFKKLHAISDLGQERALLLQRRSQAEQGREDQGAAVAALEAQLAVLGRLERAEPDTIGMYEERDPDVRLQNANAGLQELRTKLAAARDKYKDGSRVVTGLRAEIAASEAEAARLSRNGAASVVRKGRNPSLDPLHLDRARVTAELAAAEAKLDSMQGQVRQLGLALDELDGQEAGLAVLERQRATAEQAFHETSRILADRHLSEAEEARRLANVRIIQSALVPQHPRATSLLVIAAGFVFAALGAFGWMVAMFILRPVFMTGEGLASATGLNVLAVFHLVPDQDRAELLTV